MNETILILLIALVFPVLYVWMRRRQESRSDLSRTDSREVADLSELSEPEPKPGAKTPPVKSAGK